MRLVLKTDRSFRRSGETLGTRLMPPLSLFYGIIIQMFGDDHAPPHF